MTPIGLTALHRPPKRPPGPPGTVARPLCVPATRAAHLRPAPLLSLLLGGLPSARPPPAVGLPGGEGPVPPAALHASLSVSAALGGPWGGTSLPVISPLLTPLPAPCQLLRNLPTPSPVSALPGFPRLPPHPRAETPAPHSVSGDRRAVTCSPNSPPRPSSFARGQVCLFQALSPPGSLRPAGAAPGATLLCQVQRLRVLWFSPLSPPAHKTPRTTCVPVISPLLGSSCLVVRLL